MLKNNKGQGLIEYLIIVALVGVATIGMVRILGNTIEKQLASITNGLQGRPDKKVEMEQIESNDYQKKDLSDFLKGSTSKKEKR
ncbi:MAG: hypothetical protein SGJ18_05605 [Pseudomonadota bacterium]|nr:hypothetical protein [Pseudomonadota bacterium]